MAHALKNIPGRAVKVPGGNSEVTDAADLKHLAISNTWRVERLRSLVFR